MTETDFSILILYGFFSFFFSSDKPKQQQKIEQKLTVNLDCLSSSPVSWESHWWVGTEPTPNQCPMSHIYGIKETENYDALFETPCDEYDEKQRRVSNYMSTL